MQEAEMPLPDRLSLPPGTAVERYENCIEITFARERDKQRYLKPANGLMGKLCADCLEIGVEHIGIAIGRGYVIAISAREFCQGENSKCLSLLRLRR
jgi:hypothetical protein